MTAVVNNTPKILSLLQEAELSDIRQNIRPVCLKNSELAGNEICFFHVKNLTFDEDYPHREAFENVLQALDNEAFNFVYILDGDENGINLYIGVVKNQNENSPVLGKMLNAANYGKTIAGIFEGNFSGSILERLTGQDLVDKIIDAPQQFKNAGVIVGIPSINEQKNDNSKYGFQGIDRLINSMLGLKWRLVVVCDPVSKGEINQIREDVYRIYDELSPFAQQSVQHSTNSSRNVTEGTSQSTSEGTSNSSAKGVNFSESHSHTDSHGRQSDHSNSGYSDQRGDSYGESTTDTSGRSTTNSRGSNRSVGINTGNSQAMTIEIVNKKSKEILKYIDEELLERLKIGFSKGLFKTSIYYMGKNPADSNRLKVGLMSLFQGNRSSYSPLRSEVLDVEHNSDILAKYQSYYFRDENLLPEQLILLNRPNVDGKIGLNTYMTTSEVSLIAGLPQKEIPGISVKEGVDFGLNFEQTNGDILLGNLIQKGRELESIPVKINRKILNKHVFVSGVTGSGKTTTCQTLLKEADYKFLVIEPAKTEYRALMNLPDFKNVTVFTVGDELTAPFRLNPFELVHGESLTAHIDMLKATFTSSFPMEASMPQLLEEAIYKIYEDKGWDFDTNRNYLIEARKSYKEGDEYRDASAFPILSDFLKALEEIVDTKGFSDRLRDDYRGSLISRFSNLIKGSKGALFNCRKSVNFEHIINSNVIIEMENLKSSEDKALLMGFILTRLAAVIKSRHDEDLDFRHITLIEEAHRLLSKVEYGDSGSKRTAVETFTDMLAEVRKYGESFIIVDQIPNKLASEVLKNTNTKIIHKLFARDDKEAVGDTMMMDDKQKNFLSALETGQAIIFTEGMSHPVHTKIQQVTDTSDVTISNKLVKSRFMKNFFTLYSDIEIVQKFYRPLNELLKNFVKDLLESVLSDETLESVKKFKMKIMEDDLEFDESHTAQVLSEEFAKRYQCDKIFEKRLASFIKLAIAEDNLTYETVFSDRENHHLIDNIDSIFKVK